MLAALTASAEELPAPAEPKAAPVAATCAASEGEVALERKGEEPEALESGGAVRIGDRVRVGKLSFARLDMGGGGLRLSDGAMVQLRAPAAGGGGQGQEPAISVEAGVVRGFVNATIGAEATPRVAFQVGDGPRSILEARGGRPAHFRLTRTTDGTEVAVTQGEAAVLATGNERTLRAGQATVVTKGEVSGVKDLIGPPAVTAPGLDERFFGPGLVLRLSWQAVEGATGYRVQVATDAGFQSLVLALETPQAHALFVPASPGKYLWRVAARDAEQRYGELGEARPLFCEREMPEDKLLAPEPNSIAKYLDFSPRFNTPAKVVFTWKAVPGVKSYRLAVSRKPDLRAPDAVTVTTTEPRAEVANLENADHYWGVYAEDAIPEPLFLSPRKFTPKRLKPARGVKIPSSLRNWGQ